MRIENSRTYSKTMRRVHAGIASAAFLAVLGAAAYAQVASGASSALQPAPLTPSATTALAAPAANAPIAVAAPATAPAATAAATLPPLAVAHNSPASLPVAGGMGGSNGIALPASGSSGLPNLIAQASAATAGEGDALPNGKSQIARDIASSEQKATDSAKSMVKHLDTSSDAMTLQDLNSARQTVARLEAIIEVEKKLAEIDKIHNERNNNDSKKESAKALASTIPASALAPLPTFGMAQRAMSGGNMGTMNLRPQARPAPVVAVKEKPRLLAPMLEISRISGSDGKYVAMIRFPDGQVKTAHDGDHIAEGLTVRWITSTGVGIEESGSTHTIRIRNVDMIYSAMR